MSGPHAPGLRAGSSTASASYLLRDVTNEPRAWSRRQVESHLFLLLFLLLFNVRLQRLRQAEDIHFFLVLGLPFLKLLQILQLPAEVVGSGEGRQAL